MRSCTDRGIISHTIIKNNRRINWPLVTGPELIRWDVVVVRLVLWYDHEIAGEHWFSNNAIAG